MKSLNAACWGLALHILCGCTLLFDSKPVPADAGQDMAADTDAEVSPDFPLPDLDADPASDDVFTDPMPDDGMDDRVDSSDLPADEDPFGPCGGLILERSGRFFSVLAGDPVLEITLPGISSGFTCLRWEFDMYMALPDESDGCSTPRGLSEAAAGGHLLGAAYMILMRSIAECEEMPIKELSARCWYNPPDPGTWLFSAPTTHDWELHRTYHVSMEISLESRQLTATLSDETGQVGPAAVLDISEAGFTCMETADAFLRFGIGPEVTNYTAYTGSLYSNLQVWALACP